MGQDPTNHSVGMKTFPYAPFAASAKARKRYTKEFLLSIAELDGCNKQPSGIDPQLLRSIANEGVDAPSSSARGLLYRERDRDAGGSQPPDVPEWRRTPANRYENGHSRGTYDRSTWQSTGSQGRWDYRAGGNDRERDCIHHERDGTEQDSGRHIHANGNHSHQGSPSEHDGILGSGAGSRSLRCSGTSGIPNTRGNDRHGSVRINQANEGYRFHRQSKLSVYARSETRDKYNDETFGSEDTSNEERIEIERRRRDSFEMMRKEQQRSLSEKQKGNAQKQSQQYLMQPSKKSSDDAFVEAKNDKLEENSALLPLPDRGRNSFPKVSMSGASTSATLRPLVPPGFSNTFSGRQVPKAKNTEASTEVQATENLENDNNNKIKDSFNNKGGQEEGQPVAVDSRTGKHESQATIQESSIETIGGGTCKVQLEMALISKTKRTQPCPEASSDPIKNDRAVLSESEHSCWTPGLDNITSFSSSGNMESGRDVKERPESIMNRLFGKESAELKGHDASDKVEDEASEQNSTKAPKCSKFAHWFHTTDESSNDISDEGSSNIISLFSKKENLISDIPLSETRIEERDKRTNSGESLFRFQNPGRATPMPAGPCLEDIEKVMTASGGGKMDEETERSQVLENGKSVSSGVSCNTSVPESWNRKDQQLGTSQLPRNILMCEDLEQSMIAETSKQVSKLRLDPVDNHIVSDKSGLISKSGEANENESQCLLSLLKKGLESDDLNVSASKEREDLIANLSEDAKEDHDTCDRETPAVSEKTGAQTLELLFGKAFMEELRSSDAPVSAKTSATGNPHYQGAFVEDVSKRMMAQHIQEPEFTDMKSRFKDDHSAISDAANEFLRTKSRGGPHHSSMPADTVNMHSSGAIEHLLGMLPEQNSGVTQHQLVAPVDNPFNPSSLSGMHAQTPSPFIPFRHVVGPRSLHANMNPMNAIPPHWMNLHPSQNQHGNSLDAVCASSEWPEESLGRPFPKEAQVQMLHSFHNNPCPNQAMNQSVAHHGIPPKHYLQAVSLASRGPPVSNFPGPERMQHGHQGLPPRYVHAPRSHISEGPFHSIQNQPFHLHGNYNSFPTPNYSVGSVHGSSTDYVIPGNACENVGAVGHDGTILDVLFTKEQKRQLSGQTYPGQFSGGKMGYG
eukprot:TRINITY_DN4350_c0_g1_i1.p1 TRINITY_DN4350_c0_g1~~TRINITY_DN4350_c0_g1_i1.p1  ORF type:complete len:1141 (-),score=320.23 TRINITY_DN4350_c0_g1_i1:127-3549(-)